ncbi:MAG TPA: phospholipid carrier-dependent glycosyltransferase [Synechococcales cyanobacterium M55_K2018_004]|nr:phospholipid carrier-dependent glycosyltransferase [Synechococcales cyanobacterium M55_K2018_004]
MSIRPKLEPASPSTWASSATITSRIPWFWLGMASIFLVSLGLRFWGLSRFNVLVFDEVYYANFAAGFLRGEQQFGGHPPLSTYIHAFGIWVAQDLGWGDPSLSNNLTGTLLTTFSYRWINALIGSFIPWVVGAIAFQLIPRYSFAFLAALFAAADGLFLVESRYALNNIFLVLFGLLGHLFLLLALKARRRQLSGDFSEDGKSDRTVTLEFWTLLTLAGIGFAAAIAIKWNGAGFLLGAYLLWAIAWGVRWCESRRGISQGYLRGRDLSPLETLSRLTPLHVLYALALVPAIAYRLSWIPYEQLNPSKSFWQWQLAVLDYHQRVGGMEAHPYCSPWYSWPLMARPVAYFYQVGAGAGETPLPGRSGEVFYDVHAIGNPILWWLSTAAIVLIAVVLLVQVWKTCRRLIDAHLPAPTSVLTPKRPSTWAMAFLVTNWATNWLPWAKVTRCVFLYHYMGASVFSLMAIALIVDRNLRSQEPTRRQLAIGAIGLVLLAFVFWMPLYLGLPMSATGLQIRRWFPSWI